MRSRSRGRVALPATLSLLVRYCAAHGWCEDAVRTRAECTCSTAVFVHERSQHAAFAHPPPPRAPVRNRRHMHETKPPHPGPSFRSTGARSIGPHSFTSFQLPACRCHPHTDSHGLTRAAGLPYANARFSGIMRCEGAYASSPTRYPHVAHLRKTFRDGGDTKGTGTLGGEGVLRRPDSWRKAGTYLADASDDRSTANTTRSALASIHSRTRRRLAAAAWPARGLDLRTLDRTLTRSACG